MKSFQRDQARRAYLNYQWAMHMRRQAQDQRRHYQHPYSDDSQWGQWQWRARQNWQNWQSRTAPRPVIRWR